MLTAGNFTILDVFDKNNVSWDPRQTFLNMAFMTYASWDFPSDARGYSWGGTAELYWDDWALRIGRITPPQNPNSLAIDFRIWKFYGDQIVKDPRICLRRTVSSGALRRKTSAGSASGQGFFLGITPAATGRMCGN